MREDPPLSPKEAVIQARVVPADGGQRLELAAKAYSCAMELERNETEFLPSTLRTMHCSHNWLWKLLQQRALLIPSPESPCPCHEDMPTEWEKRTPTPSAKHVICSPVINNRDYNARVLLLPLPQHLVSTAVNWTYVSIMKGGVIQRHVAGSVCSEIIPWSELYTQPQEVVAVDASNSIWAEISKPFGCPRTIPPMALQGDCNLLSGFRPATKADWFVPWVVLDYNPQQSLPVKHLQASK